MLYMVDVCDPQKSIYHLSLKMPSECYVGKNSSAMMQKWMIPEAC